MKVPLSVAWLSEECLLNIALKQLDMSIVETRKKEVIVLDLKDNKPVTLLWTDYLTFTLDQLREIGFK
jgi:hypothetical protein